MKKTRSVHNLYKEWLKLPNDIRKLRYFERGCMVGKWHYHYENENGKIGLVRFNDNMDFFNNTKKYCYEACGTLDFERFSSISQAESAIYEKLGESLLQKSNHVSDKNPYKKRSKKSNSYNITN